MDLNDLQQVQEEEIENETDGHKSKEIITKEIVEGEFDDINDDEKIKEDEPKLPLTSLKGLAELDCCVTVIDASNMLAQLNSIKRVQVNSPFPPIFNCGQQHSLSKSNSPLHVYRIQTYVQKRFGITSSSGLEIECL